MRFEGKRVLVTGASGGIGAVLVESFLREGAQVVATDRLCDGGQDAAHWIEGDLLDGGF